MADRLCLPTGWRNPPLLPANARKGEFLARGVHGQFIYVNQPQRVMIAMSSADDIPEDDAVFAENIAMFRHISEGL